MHGYSQTLNWLNQIKDDAEIFNGFVIDVEAMPDGSTYVCGHVVGTVDFDPNLTHMELTANGGEGFIAKYNADGHCLWVRLLNSTVASSFTSLALSSDGDIYVTGEFSGECDLDPTSGVLNFTAATTGNFFAKYTPSGNFVFAKQLKRVGNHTNAQAKINVSQNNEIFLTGNASGTTDFDPGAGVLNITAAAQDFFMAKYTINGDLVWAHVIGGNDDEYLQDAVIGIDGSIHVVGQFKDVVDFDPSPSQRLLTSSGESDMYIAKYNTNGQFINAQKIGGISFDQAGDIFIDLKNNIYFSGHFTGAVDFDPSQATVMHSVANSTSFIAKYDSSFNYEWVYPFIGTQGNLIQVHDVLPDPESDEFYIMGRARGNMVLDESGYQLNLAGEGNCAFVGRYNSDGKALFANKLSNAVTTFNTVGSDMGTFSMDKNKNFYTTGRLVGDTDFDPTAGTEIVEIGNGGGHPFTASYNNCATLIEATVTTNGSSIQATEGGLSYQWYNCENDEKIPGATQSLFLPTHSGNYKVLVSQDFCSKMSECISISFASVADYESNDQVLIYPNPTTDLLYIDGMGKYNIHIFSQDGKLVYSENGFNKTAIDVSSLSKGLYTIQTISENDFNASIKFIKQ